MRAKLLTFALAALAVSACGPTVSIQAGVDPVGADIFFGRPAPSPLPPPVVQLPNFPAPLELPPLPLYIPPAIKPDCPAALPIDYPKHEAPGTASAPPLPGVYKFRYQGSDTTDFKLATQKVTQINGTGTREVKNIQTFSDHFTFDVVETFDGKTQTNSYEVYPQSRAASALPSGVGPDAGLYLTGMTIDTQSFNPVPPIQLLAFPANPGPETLASTGSDGKTTMEIDPNSANPSSSFIQGLANVNACGTVLQSWQDLLAGRIVTTAGSGPNESFSLTLFVGTQYGALSLEDQLSLDETGADGQPEHFVLNATIDQEPALAR